MKKWLLLGLIVVLVLLVYWYSRAEPISIQAVQVDHGDVTETVANTRSTGVPQAGNRSPGHRQEAEML